MTALDELRAGGKAALARALARVEARPDDASTVALLDAAWAAQIGHAIGLTGPPGVGKSTLIDALIRAFRARGARVAVMAVDPSSRHSGGALLGDRTRLTTDPDDAGVFVRSMAARDRLGGLAGLAFPSLALMRALHDVVIVETVGVGQSETEIDDVADTVVLCVQPGAGDALQFMKAGVVEIPDIAVVTKADMGAPAQRAAADLKGALSLAAQRGEPVEVMSCSATTGDGIESLVNSLQERALRLSTSGAQASHRDAQMRAWLRREIRESFGTEGFAYLRRTIDDETVNRSPFSVAAAAKARGKKALNVGFTPQ